MVGTGGLRKRKIEEGRILGPAEEFIKDDGDGI